jgi:hypothetical protein
MPFDLPHSCFDCRKPGVHLDKRRPFDIYLIYCLVPAANQETPKAVI